MECGGRGIPGDERERKCKNVGVGGSGLKALYRR